MAIYFVCTVCRVLPPQGLCPSQALHVWFCVDVVVRFDDVTVLSRVRILGFQVLKLLRH